MKKEKEPLRMFEEFNPQDAIVYNKSFMFVKGFAVGKGNNMPNTLCALSLCRLLHDGQYRRDGTPYIMHPLKVTTTLINYGIDDDITLAAALLHDVLEDCQDKLPLNGRELITEYHLAPEVLEIVRLLTKESGLDQYELSRYFDKIKRNPKALLIKLSDRLHNSCTLYSFTPEKMAKYIKETQDFILPIAKYGKAYYPQYMNTFAMLKSNIYSLNHSMEVMMQNYVVHMQDLEKQLEDKDLKIKELQEELEKLQNKN